MEIQEKITVTKSIIYDQDKKIKQLGVENLKLMKKMKANLQHDNLKITMRKVNARYKKAKLKDSIYIYNAYILIILKELKELVTNIAFTTNTLSCTNCTKLIENIEKASFIRNQAFNKPKDIIDEHLLNILKNKMKEYESELKELESLISLKQNNLKEDDILSSEKFVVMQLKDKKQKVENKMKDIYKLVF